MPYARSGGVKLYYEEAGTGPPILFLHELGSDIRQWRGQTEPLSRDFRCIAYNARGYPPSDVPEADEAYLWERFVEDICAVLDHLNIDRAVLVGWSMGAYAALMFALRQPGRVASVVAAGVGSGSPRADQAEFRAGMRALADAWEHLGPDTAAELMAQSPNRRPLKRSNPEAFEAWLSDLKTHAPLGMARTCRNYQGLRPSLEDFVRDFAVLPPPVLLLVGDRDAPCLETTRILAQAIPAADLRVAPDMGHSLNLENQARFNRLIEEFIASQQNDARL